MKCHIPPCKPKIPINVNNAKGDRAQRPKATVPYEKYGWCGKVRER